MSYPPSIHPSRTGLGMLTVVKTLTSQRLEWILVCGTIGLSALLIGFCRGGAPELGEVRSITVSIIPADKRGLGCAHEEPIAGLSCAYAKAEPKAPHRKLKEDVRLAPYVTIQGELVVLGGVFAGDEVVQASVGRNARKNRFNVTCNVKLVAEMAKLPIRFSVRDEFKPADLTWIGHATDCIVSP